MTITRRLSIVLVLVIVASGCSKKIVREEDYIPSKKTVQLKGHSRVQPLWSRWDERVSNNILINGKAVISSSYIQSALADDPSLEVASHLKSSLSWHNASQILAGSALTIAALGAFGFAHLDNNTTPVLTPAASFSLLGIGTILTGGALFCEGQSTSQLSVALSLHNESFRLGSSTSASLDLGWRW